jgi:phosphosulfolactate synthase (CoM biosynthesis protein A)
VTDPERDTRRGFDFIELNQRTPKPRTNRGVTEIRGTHYKPLGTRALKDTLEAMGEYIDTLKFAGGSFAIMPRAVSAKIIDICHSYDVKVSTGGALEHALMRRGDVVSRLVDGLGLEHLMFEAADPVVFAWYVRLYGAEVNLFIDHSQIYHLESLRSGVGGGGPLWGRVLTYNPDAG